MSRGLVAILLEAIARLEEYALLVFHKTTQAGPQVVCFLIAMISGVPRQVYQIAFSNP